MGHISPLIGIILSLKNEYEFIYFGLKGSMEERICQENNISFHAMNLIPFNRKNILINVKTFYLILKERRIIKKKYKNENVKAIISSGGFVSIPLVLSLRKVKKILLESNTSLGLANRFLLPFVDVLGVQFPTINNKKVVQVGNPIIIYHSNFDHPFFYLKEKPILFVGGSNGAIDIVRCAYMFNQKYPDVKILVITGKNYQDDFQFNNNAKLFKLIPKLSGVLNKFSIVVSRAGAATITELLLSNVCFMLYPSKNVSANHQEKNAKYIESFNKTIVINETNDSSIDLIYNLLKDENKQRQMKENNVNIIIKDSIERIRKLIL